MIRSDEAAVESESEGSQRTGGATPDTAPPSGSTPRRATGTASQRESLLSEPDSTQECPATYNPEPLSDVPMRRTRSAPRHGRLIPWVAPGPTIVLGQGAAPSGSRGLQPRTPQLAARARASGPDDGGDAHTDRRDATTALPSRPRRSTSISDIGRVPQARPTRVTGRPAAAASYVRSVCGGSGVLDQDQGQRIEGESCCPRHTKGAMAHISCVASAGFCPGLGKELGSGALRGSR